MGRRLGRRSGGYDRHAVCIWICYYSVILLYHSITVLYVFTIDREFASTKMMSSDCVRSTPYRYI